MSGFYIFKTGSEQPIEVTSRGLIAALADPSVIGDLFFALKPGVILPIDLKDGPATVQRVPHKAAPSQQRLLLPQPLLPIQPYRAHVQLKFILPVMVDLRAHSSAHVRETIKDVVSGQCGVPRDFRFRVTPEDLSALMAKMETCDMTAISDVEVISVAPYHLLTNEREG
jgi:hypothetical protein